LCQRRPLPQISTSSRAGLHCEITRRACASGAELHAAAAHKCAVMDCSPVVGSAGSARYSRAADRRHMVAARLRPALDRSWGAGHGWTAAGNCMALAHSRLADRSREAGHTRGVPHRGTAVARSPVVANHSWEAAHSRAAPHNHTAHRNHTVAESPPGLEHVRPMRPQQGALPRWQSQFDDSP
jgi:hypothetical protein